MRLVNEMICLAWTMDPLKKGKLGEAPIRKQFATLEYNNRYRMEPKIAVLKDSSLN